MKQTEIEHATGLSREVLRKWELRYQCPRPRRGARGQRLYDAKDLPKQQLLRRLTALGLLPGKLMPLSLTELQSLLDSTCDASDPRALDDAVQQLLACLAPDSVPGAVRDYLAGLIDSEGLAQFVELRLPLFNQAVGDAWAAGRLGVHAEHHYSHAVQWVVQSRLPGRQPTNFQQRILLTTPPGELHGLGLLAVHAALTLQGADCFNMGTQTPASDVVQAVKDWDITLLAISASVAVRPELARSYVMALRRALPRRCRIWVGGRGFLSLKASPVAGVKVFQTTAQAVQAWKKMTIGS